MIQLKTRAVEEVVARRFAIAEHGRTALRGRLEHLRKLGTPKGVQKGQGRAAVFGWDEILQLAVAVELLNVGVTPDHAHSVVQNGGVDLLQGFAHFAFDIGGGLLDAIEAKRAPSNHAMPFLLTADAFSGMREEGAANPIMVVRHIAEGDPRRLPGEVTISRVSLELGTTAVRLLDAMSKALDQPKSLLVESFQEWAASNVQHP